LHYNMSMEVEESLLLHIDASSDDIEVYDLAEEDCQGVQDLMDERCDSFQEELPASIYTLDDLKRAPSCASTASLHDLSSQVDWPDSSSLASDSGWALPEQTPWQRALLRAELVAKSYVPPRLTVEVQMTRSRRQKRLNEDTKISKFCRDLRERHDAHVQIGRGSHLDPFDQFRMEFLLQHGNQACASLKSCFRGPIQLRLTPLSNQVQQRFFNAVRGSLPGVLQPAFHGTDARNLTSIYTRGLLIPGHGNDLTVVHGAAHGRGIYTAKLHDASLSFGFSRGAVLICGVLDDAEETAQPQPLGRFSVTQESKNVRHVGNAMVVFDPLRVAPLWEASLLGANLVRRPIANANGPIATPSVKRPKQVLLVRQPLRRTDYLNRRAARKRRLKGL
jgi:hypothetical protein